MRTALRPNIDISDYLRASGFGRGEDAFNDGDYWGASVMCVGVTDDSTAEALMVLGAREAIRAGATVPPGTQRNKRQETVTVLAIFDTFLKAINFVTRFHARGAGVYAPVVIIQPMDQIVGPG